MNEEGRTNKIIEYVRILEEHINVLKKNVNCLKCTIDMQTKRIEDRDKKIAEMTEDIKNYDTILCETFSKDIVKNPK